MNGVRAKLFRYFLTAGVAAIVDIGGFAVLSLTPIPILLSAIASFCVAAVANYILSSRLAFHATPTFAGFGVFLLAAVVGLLVNVSVTLISSKYLTFAPVVAKVAGVGAAFMVNFWLNLRVVFRTRS